MRGLEWILGAILVPLLSLVLDHWVRVIGQRRRAECLIGQTMAYLQRAASESKPQQDANARLTMLAADFTDKAMMDGLSPSPPNSDLVAYDTLPNDQTERSMSDRQPAFVRAFLQSCSPYTCEWPRACGHNGA